MSAEWLEQDVDVSLSWFKRSKVTKDCRLEGLGDRQSIGKVLDRLLQNGALLKSDKTTTVCVVETNEGPLVVKRYNARSFWHRITRLVRKSRASRCWSMSYQFELAGLNVARPLLMFEHRFGPLRRGAYFAAQKISATELISAFPSMDSSERGEVVKAIDEVFEKMRIARISHGDMKASNLMWSSGEIYFVDLDAAKQHRNESSWKKANKKDVARWLKNWRSDQELVDFFLHLQK